MSKIEIYTNKNNDVQQHCSIINYNYDDFSALNILYLLFFYEMERVGQEHSWDLFSLNRLFVNQFIYRYGLITP